MEFLIHTNNIRNICILAHVDHGKTTIADSLIASNGIISHRMAGKMRYMDNRPDEQERGITMKSSSIALKYFDAQEQRYLINLIDTPGHVDFCGEVSAALRLCDGALIVVDVVEGVCPQTKTALEQAWREGIKPILVFNKIDRFILEQQIDETAAHLRLNQLLEQVNAIVASLLTAEIFEESSLKTANDSSQNAANSTLKTGETRADAVDSVHVYDWASAIDDIDDDKYYFMPEKNNVIFASSIDDWAFSIETFAGILSVRHNINKKALQKTLWGDFYVDVKKKMILKNAQSKAKKTLFVSMILKNIWKIYDSIAVRRDQIKLKEICDTLGVELSPREANHSDFRYKTKLILSKWLKLSNNVLKSIVEIVPSPKELSEKRIERLLTSNLKQFHQLPDESQKLKHHYLKCSFDESAIKVACVSKMFAYEKQNLPRYRTRPDKKLQSEAAVECHREEDNSAEIKENDVVFIAFARIFSGKFEKGDRIFVLNPRHDVTKSKLINMDAIDKARSVAELELDEHVTVSTIERLYLLMGRDIEEVDVAYAGNIVGFEGLEKHLIRTATLSNNLHCPPFHDLHLPATPILRVAIEPRNPSDMTALVEGLKLLNQADPCVKVRLQKTGEHVIIATGEVHLQRCIKDLSERYTDNIELNVSQPIVPFRETIVLRPKVDMTNETIDDNNTNLQAKTPLSSTKIQAFELHTPNRKCRMRIKASPLPERVQDCLNEHADFLKVMAKIITARVKPDVEIANCEVKIGEFKRLLSTAFEESRKARSEWKSLYHPDIIDHIWSFGPKYYGPNLLVASSSLTSQYNHWKRLDNQLLMNDRDDEMRYIDSFISGFQLATQAGPLCEEPIMGVCFTIEEWSFETGYDETNSDKNSRILDASPSFDSDAKCADQTANEEESAPQQHLQRDNYGPISGQIISTVKECCRRAFQLQPQRLMSPMFKCEIQVTTEVLGKMYAVIAKRNGRIIHGDMREGSQTFDINAFIPVIESLDFVNEIRKQTSGQANPQLVFSHYEVVNVDPFWVPNTEEEYALFGEKGDNENLARKYMNLVRRRKGLSVQEKIVEHGEKQRTMKRNK